MKIQVPMKIQVLCPHFEPDTAPTGLVMSQIAAAWVAEGHEVHVVTSLPWYRAHEVEPGWEGRPVRIERTAWGSITRVHPFPTSKANIPARAAAFAAFTGLSTLVGAARRVPADVVLAMSPPLTLGYAGWLVARRRRVPFVFNIQDVFPDVAVDLGVMTNPRLIAAAHRMERVAYQRADAVTVLSEDLRRNLVAKLGPREGGSRVRVIPNFVDTRRIRPAERLNAYRADHDLGEGQVVMYAGNVGFSQSLGLLVDAARHHADRDDVVFVINGNGAARSDLEAQAADLPNLRFVDYQPAARLPEVLAAADVHVVTLATGLGRSSVPSKFYSVLAAGRPVVASIDPDTELARVIGRIGAGLAVPPDDPGAFIEAIATYLDDPARARADGARGRAFVEGWVSPVAVGRAYTDLFTDLIDRRRRGARPPRSAVDHPAKGAPRS